MEESGVLGPFYCVVAGSIFASKVLAKVKPCAQSPPLRTDPESSRQQAGRGASAILFVSLWQEVGSGGGKLSLDKAGDSKQARLSTRSSLGASYNSSVH